MFERFKRSIAAQRAGHDAFMKIMFIVEGKAPSICTEIERSTNLPITSHIEKAAQLLCVYFFDYVVQNIALREVASAYQQTDKRDLNMFINGADLALKNNSAFGQVGLKLQENFYDRCAEARERNGPSMPPEVYAELIGSWFLESLEFNPSPDVATRVGGILRDHARQLFINPES